MNRTALAATAAAVLLLLTGCTAAVQPGPDASEAIAASPSAATSTAPLKAETPASAPTTTHSRDDAAYVAEVRATLRPANVIPNATDDQLIQAGLKACELRDGGTAAEDITVIDGEERIYGAYLDSGKIYDAAVKHLC